MKNDKFYVFDEERRNLHGENIDECDSFETNSKNAFFIRSLDNHMTMVMFVEAICWKMTNVMKSFPTPSQIDS